MKKLSKERIYEFAYEYAEYTYAHIIADDEILDYLEIDDSYLFQVLYLNQEVFMRYLSESGWYDDENEMEEFENNSEFFFEEIIEEVVGQLRDMLQSEIDD